MNEKVCKQRSVLRGTRKEGRRSMGYMYILYVLSITTYESRRAVNLRTKKGRGGEKAVQLINKGVPVSKSSKSWTDVRSYIKEPM